MSPVVCATASEPAMHENAKKPASNFCLRDFTGHPLSECELAHQREANLAVPQPAGRRIRRRTLCRVTLTFPCNLKGFRNYRHAHRGEARISSRRSFAVGATVAWLSLPEATVENALHPPGAAAIISGTLHIAAAWLRAAVRCRRDLPGAGPFPKDTHVRRTRKRAGDLPEAHAEVARGAREGRAPCAARRGE